MTHSKTIKRMTSRTAPTTLQDAATWLEELGSEQDAIHYRGSPTTIRDLADNETRVIMLARMGNRIDPKRVHISYNMINSRGRLVIRHGTVLGMIVDRLILRRTKS